jgi:hypothetical protein
MTLINNFLMTPPSSPLLLIDFRVNKYCGELLQIGNEDWDLRRNLNWSEVAKGNKRDEELEDGSGEAPRGPHTAALRHNEMNYYQVTNLKIMKADKNETNSLPASVLRPQAKNITEIKLTRQNEGGKDKPRSKVYSQVI